MKSISVIEKVFMMSNENKMFKDIIEKNSQETINEFIENYVAPHLQKEYIDIIGTKIMAEKWKDIGVYTMGFIKKWDNGYIKKMLEKQFNYLNHQKFLPNMIKNSPKIYDIPENQKKILGKEYAEFVYKIATFDTKSKEYLNSYVVPILKNENKIIFNLNSNDEHITLITQKTLDLFLKYIYELGSMTFHNFLFEDEDNEIEEFKLINNYFNFLFNDDKETNEYIAKSLCEVFIENYDKIDLTEKTNINIYWLYQFVPPYMFEEE